MKVMDLFSGVGGFSLGLERAGMHTVAFCEIDPFCRAVLKKHWPSMPCYEDIKTLTGERLHADGIVPDLICGGFPCQDISIAGKGAGIDGERSGLWSEYARLIGELLPRYVIVENVSALLARGIDRVLGDLAALGYDTEWAIVSAAAVGAPHRRERLWLVAYPDSQRLEGRNGSILSECSDEQPSWTSGSFTSNADSVRELQPPRILGNVRRWLGNGSWGISESNVGRVAYGFSTELDGCGYGKEASEAIGEIWREEPDIPRIAKGVQGRVNRLRSLGNAVVPQIPEIIGRAILAYEESL